MTGKRKTTKRRTAKAAPLPDLPVEDLTVPAADVEAMQRAITAGAVRLDLAINAFARLANVRAADKVLNEQWDCDRAAAYARAEVDALQQQLAAVQ